PASAGNPSGAPSTPGARGGTGAHREGLTGSGASSSASATSHNAPVVMRCHRVPQQALRT
ncbi:unnamed protein product, partial [Amoebophrya sp. A25]